MLPTYLAKKFANKFQVYEHNTLEQVCQTQTLDWAHKIAARLNEAETEKAGAISQAYVASEK